MRLAEMEPLTGRVGALERQLAERERSRTGLVRDLESEIRALRSHFAEFKPRSQTPRLYEIADHAGEFRPAGEGISDTTPLSSEDRRMALEAEVAVLREVVAWRDREIADLRADSPAPVAKSAQPRSTGPGDDLQLIRGIGPVLDRLLHRLGIDRFQQIARLNEEDITRMGRQLEGFSGRICRDHWVEGARRESIRSYGRDPISSEPVPVPR